jgi:hypothetical protein
MSFATALTPAVTETAIGRIAPLFRTVTGGDGVPECEASETMLAA